MTTFFETIYNQPALTNLQCQILCMETPKNQIDCVCNDCLAVVIKFLIMEQYAVEKKQK